MKHVQGFFYVFLPLLLLGSSSYAYAKEPTNKEVKESTAALNLDLPSPDLGSQKTTLKQLRDKAPESTEVLELDLQFKDESARGIKKTKPIIDTFEYQWQVDDIVDEPTIETPNQETTITDVLALDPRNKEALEQLRGVSQKKFSLASFLASLEGSRWGGGFRIGTYKPSLSNLNHGLFQASTSGFGSVFIDPNKPDAGQINTPFSFTNRIPAFHQSKEVGIEFRKELDRKHSYVIGLGSWEANSQSDPLEVALPIQNLLTKADAIRRARFSFTQFYFGWKYNVFQWPKKLRFYTRLAINEYFDIDYREDHIYTFKEFDISGFKRLLITRTQTTGAFAVAGGIGAEYFFSEWFSFGFEANRIVSLSSFNLRNVKENTDLDTTERNSFKKLPYDFDERGNLLFRRSDDSTQVVKLRFDGWKYLFNMTFYY